MTRYRHYELQSYYKASIDCKRGWLLSNNYILCQRIINAETSSCTATMPDGKLPMYLIMRYPGHYICQGCIRYKYNVISHEFSDMFSCRWCNQKVKHTSSRIVNHVKVCPEKPQQFDSYKCDCYEKEQLRKQLEPQNQMTGNLKVPESTWVQPETEEDWDFEDLAHVLTTAGYFETKPL